MQNLLRGIIESNKIYTKEGTVASYIPELGKANKEDLGVCVVRLDGKEFIAGDAEKNFTMQSMSKVIALILAILDNGKKSVFSKVGMEPTGDSFNSITSLEVKHPERPFNPMINAGAIATTALISGETDEEKIENILSFTRKITGNKFITINEEVYRSEKATGNRNRALAYFMKSNGLLDGDVESILDVYFKQCSIECNCRDIARIGSMLANDGVLPWSGEKVISREVSRIVKTIMVTCGMYDASGEFAVGIGIPAKSGVGGGILASVPRRMGIGVYGPSLDEKGNSVGGIKILKELSDELDLSIF
ncbi:glutaminase A [Clostridium algidicarnis]|uniref:glutaminase A n=1 Tax=Clostridium algidicarnis TaxID=37659 RepID=UPI001C0C8E45|nr:glutaminase A [Clostridium algidicarnis]MBU3196082.1 glutaminase A [Clostridium algidicarnis]MBU3209127.1 glutaminase A [Clostridium algidicarnis]MBU3229036.1 glutaminase A [Clostridium algidicarnis]MBU3252545.1 glutaminase A [Clostridium algidicarnis]